MSALVSLQALVMKNDAGLRPRPPLAEEPCVPPAPVPPPPNRSQTALDEHRGRIRWSHGVKVLGAGWWRLGVLVGGGKTLACARHSVRLHSSLVQPQGIKCLGREANSTSSDLCTHAVACDRRLRAQPSVGRARSRASKLAGGRSYWPEQKWLPGWAHPRTLATPPACCRVQAPFPTAGVWNGGGGHKH